MKSRTELLTVVRLPTTWRPRRVQIGWIPRGSREPLIVARGSMSVRNGTVNIALQISYQARIGIMICQSSAFKLRAKQDGLRTSDSVHSVYLTPKKSNPLKRKLLTDQSRVLFPLFH